MKTLVKLLVILSASTALAQEPKLWELKPIRPGYDTRDALADVRGHTDHPSPDADLGTYVHETVHQINSESRNATGKECFYLLENRIAVLAKTRRTRLADVAARVPENQRGTRYRLYLVQQQSRWNDEPLYVLDEYSAYLAGAYERYVAGTYTEINDTAALREFGPYADTLVQAVEQCEPDYPDLAELRATVTWMHHRSASITLTEKPHHR